MIPRRRTKRAPITILRKCAVCNVGEVLLILLIFIAFCFIVGVGVGLALLYFSHPQLMIH